MELISIAFIILAFLVSIFILWFSLIIFTIAGSIAAVLFLSDIIYSLILAIVLKRNK